MSTPNTHSRVGRVTAVSAVVVAGALSGVLGVGALVDADQIVADAARGQRRAPSDRRVGTHQRTDGIVTGVTHVERIRGPCRRTRPVIAEFARATG